MTPEQEIQEAVTEALQKESRWITKGSWRVLAQPSLFTVCHPKGEGDIVHRAVGTCRVELSRNETYRTYRR